MCSLYVLFMKLVTEIEDIPLESTKNSFGLAYKGLVYLKLLQE